MKQLLISYMKHKYLFWTKCCQEKIIYFTWNMKFKIWNRGSDKCSLVNEKILINERNNITKNCALAVCVLRPIHSWILSHNEHKSLGEKLRAAGCVIRYQASKQITSFACKTGRLNNTKAYKIARVCCFACYLYFRSLLSITTATFFFLKCRLVWVLVWD